MLSEEFAELIIALKNKDRREAVDWLLDVLWVWIGTLSKMWLKASEIEKAFNEIKESNYSKLIEEDWYYVAMRDTTGKIIKPAHYKKPDLSFIED
jgi:predicted HAD superfamily Cof-like phosphohydrolase